MAAICESGCTIGDGIAVLGISLSICAIAVVLIWCLFR